MFDESDTTKVTVPVKCERCQTESTITGRIDARNDVATCTEKVWKQIGYTDDLGSHTEKIYEGELASHYVVVGGVNVNFVEDGEYEYTELGLKNTDFSGDLIPDCKTAKSAWIKCEHCKVEYTVKATGKHKYNAEPDKSEDGSVKTLAPTCTNNGYSAQYTCIACGKVDVPEDKVIPYTGHTWTAKVEDGNVELTCACGSTATGIVVSWANVDGVVFTDDEGEAILDYEAIVALASKCGEKVTIKCSYKETAEGEIKVANVELAALEHDFEDANIIEFELEIGDKIFTCKAKECANCGKYYIFEKVEKVEVAA